MTMTTASEFGHVVESMADCVTFCRLCVLCCRAAGQLGGMVVYVTP